MLDEPNEVALETLAVIAERCGVQPSAIVRFAQSFGFSGASQMQRLFRDGLLVDQHRGWLWRAGSAFQRIRQPDRRRRRAADRIHRGQCPGARQSRETVAEEDMRAAVRPDRQGRTSCMSRVSGAPSRSPLISLTRFSSSASMCSSSTASAAWLGRRPTRSTTTDLLIAVSFHPYAPETVEISRRSPPRKGASILAISDSRVSPIAKSATIALQVRDSEVRSFRSLAASMCLAQAARHRLCLRKRAKAAPAQGDNEMFVAEIMPVE